MPRIGVLGLEPYLVTQLEQLDRSIVPVLMDSLDEEDREALDLEAVLVSRDHAARSRVVSRHPDPPVIVVEDADDAEPETRDAGGPIHLTRPVSSPTLREALDRCLGVPWWRRVGRVMATEQDDEATPDRWLAILRTLLALTLLGVGIRSALQPEGVFDGVGVLPFVVLAAWTVARALWWRLQPALVALDVVVVGSALVAWGAMSAAPPVTLAILAAAIAAEAGFLWGWWRALAGAAALIVVLQGVWWAAFDHAPSDVLGDAGTVLMLVLTSVGAGAMANRLRADSTSTRSSELRRFRSSLYELSRRQAVVAVSFDLGTVAEDALSRLVKDVRPRAAMVLVADGSGPLQVAASHNLASAPPVRLIWQPDTPSSKQAARSAAKAEHATPPPVEPDPQPVEPEPVEAIPEWRPSHEREPVVEEVEEPSSVAEAPVEEVAGASSDGLEDGPDGPDPFLGDDTNDILEGFPDIDPGADLDRGEAAGDDGAVDERRDPVDERSDPVDEHDDGAAGDRDGTAAGRDDTPADHGSREGGDEVSDPASMRAMALQRAMRRVQYASGAGQDDGAGSPATAPVATQGPADEPSDKDPASVGEAGRSDLVARLVAEAKRMQASTRTDAGNAPVPAIGTHPDDRARVEPPVTPSQTSAVGRTSAPAPSAPEPQPRARPVAQQPTALEAGRLARAGGAASGSRLVPPANATVDPGSGNAAGDAEEDPFGPALVHDEDAAPPTAMEVARVKAHPVRQLLARTTIRGDHGLRLREVLAQLVASLPEGPVYVDACELEGELMGALVVVDPDDDQEIQQHAEETALALDSVRLFNRLRAFTRDQERARIGRSLHDGVMQTLAHVALELDRVSNDSWDDKQVDTLAVLRDHVLGTVDEMRTVVNDLRTVRLDRGLPAALEAMALTLSPAGGPVIEVLAEEIGPQPGDVEEQFLRIAEEALHNAVQHSGARHVTVRLESREGALLLQVLDDGFGFSRTRIDRDNGGVGLTSMYQRSRSIGAGLDIDTGANGTIVTLHHQVARTAQVPVRPGQDIDHAPAPEQPPGRWWQRRD